MKKYKMLSILTEKLKEQNDNQRIYVTTLLNEFNHLMKKFDNYNDEKLKEYLLDLIHLDYKRKTNNMLPNYNKDVVTYLKNYISAKIKNTKQNE